MITIISLLSNFRVHISILTPKLSSYMKTAFQTLKKYLPHIKNTLSKPYSNGFVEGNNTFIKVTIL